MKRKTYKDILSIFGLTIGSIVVCDNGSWRITNMHWDNSEDDSKKYFVVFLKAIANSKCESGHDFFRGETVCRPLRKVLDNYERVC